MKRLIILVATLMAATTFVFAGPKRVEITSGSGKILCDASKKASFVFNYDNCYVGEISKGSLKEGAVSLSEVIAGRGEGAQDEWNQTQAELYNRFVKQWNTMNRKRTVLVPESENPDYKMVFNVTALDLGSGVAGFFGVGKAGGIILMGNVDVIDSKTEETVLTYKVNEVKGEGYPAEVMRFRSVYMQIVGDICQANIKSK